MKNSNYYLNPLYWPVWLLLGIFWLLIQLPYRWQLALGKGLGLLILKFAKKSKRIATINLKLCFPELNEQQRTELLRKTFISLGIAIFETGLAFWASDQRLNKLAHFVDIEHYERAAKDNSRGVLLVGAHYTTLEIVGRAAAIRYPFAVMYAPNKIGILDFLIRRTMTKHYEQAIPRNNMRQMLKTLQANKTVWYSADVNAGRKHSIFAPFFNILAATTSTPMRLAELSNCYVIPLIHSRRADGTGYDIKLAKPLENFPSNDPIADATRLNQIIEQAVREHPEQYLWTYMRFKTRPNGIKGIYRPTSPVLRANFNHSDEI